MKILKILGTTISVLFAAFMLYLFLSVTTGSFAFGQESIEVELQYTWLTPSNFQKLTENEQKVVIIATRDIVVYALHALNRHDEEECIKVISNEELNAVKNTIAFMPETDSEIEANTTSIITRYLTAICSVEPESEPASTPE